MAALSRKFLTLTLPQVSLHPKLNILILGAVLLAIGFLLAWLPLDIAMLLVGGTIFFALVLLHPELVLYILIPAIPFSSLVAVSVGGARAGAMELLLLLGMAAWLLQLLSHQTTHGTPLKINSGPLLIPFLFMLAGVLLSWLNVFSIRAGLIETLKWIEMFALYLFIFNLLRRKQIKWIVLVILLTGMAQAVLGLYQFIYKVGPEGFLLFGGQYLRAYGTFAQPNPYAGYLGLILPLALSVALYALERGPGSVMIAFSASIVWNRIFRFFYWAGRLALFSLPLVAMLAALYASQSRGAWLGFAAAGVATFVVRSKKTALIAVSIFVIVVLVWLAGSVNLGLEQTASAGGVNRIYTAVVQRFADSVIVFNITDVATTPVTDANFASVERLAHWQAARDMWRDNLWLGVGFGNYAAIYPAYAVGRWLDPLGHAHNYPLNLGAETGLVGILTYLIFWIWVFGLSFLAVRRSNGFLKVVAAGVIGVFVHLHVHNMVDNLYVQGMYLHVAIILGLVTLIFSCYHVQAKN